MIQHCPSCGKEYRSANKITVFGCCSHKTRKTVDGYLVKIEKPVSKRYEQAPNQQAHRLDRPGDAAYELIRSTFGITPPKGCGCNATKHRMNSLGCEKCLAEIDSLADELAANATKFGWAVTLWAGVQATLSGALAWMNPFRPWHSIIRESCRRTKAAIDGQKENSDGSRRESV